ncbi:hypothetical protein ACIQU6_38900 [Streptomyces sp. NPDC090442]|uniref:hypothetical protein n=1 Tax=Streptomyces sp. NPDC090442 TaxID=3365962 RepID=UPI00382A67BF
MPAISIALLLLGLSAGVLGLLGRNSALFEAGAFVSVVAVPLIITRTVHAAHKVTDQQLADADRAGYVRALDHVARGLLDNAPAPPNTGRRATAEHVAGNVITLRPRQQQPIDRKAQ